ncbi:hypothetical protein MPER_05969, partial [Moniliophthora perniciosa FA553]
MHISWSAFFLLSIFVSATANLVNVLNYTPLGPDPQTINRLNGESYQQDALISFDEYQYAAFWVLSSGNASVRHATIARRPFDGEWESFTLTDHNQTEDDGHNTWNINWHFSGVSKPGVASRPGETKFSQDIFGPTT